jgi:hypothetical protein
MSVSPTRLLYLKLKLKRLTNSINYEVNDNFGYCPNTQYFNQLERTRVEYEDELKAFYPAEYAVYIDQH